MQKKIKLHKHSSSMLFLQWELTVWSPYKIKANELSSSYHCFPSGGSLQSHPRSLYAYTQYLMLMVKGGGFCLPAGPTQWYDSVPSIICIFYFKDLQHLTKKKGFINNKRSKSVSTAAALGLTWYLIWRFIDGPFPKKERHRFSLAF